MTNEQLLFLDYLKNNLNYSENTIKSYSQDISLFESFLLKNNIDFRNITREDVRKFMASRLKSRTYRGKNESPRSIRRRVSALKKYYTFLYERKMVNTNPFLLIVTPKKHNKLPEVLYESQIKKLLLENSKREDYLVSRDQALLELMYSSGLRCSEVVNLTISNIDFSSRFMRVFGKGKKERLVPFSDEARKAMIDYAKNLRKEILTKNEINLREQQYFFINSKGGKLTSRGLEYIMSEIIKKTGLNLGFNLHPHVLRHTFATQLYNKGADLRMIQELMGHESIETTSIYAHVSKKKIQEEYNAFFPKGSKK